VGVEQGDRQDPWWKEGVTNYLGLLLSLQVGYYSREVIAGYLVRDLSATATVQSFALADPRVRQLFFPALNSDYTRNREPDFVSLLYGKGSQAAMLIDAGLAEGSQGRIGFPELLDELSAFGAGFTRWELTESLQRLGMKNADARLSEILDGPGGIDTLTLRKAFETLEFYGRFETQTTFILPKQGAFAASDEEIKRRLPMEAALHARLRDSEEP
jgi:predicted metalloprotease with PDZ domain